MSPPGAPDPLYVLARRVLLDALEALRPQWDALILVGAQAIYLHTGPAGLAMPEYTTDADIALDPLFLLDNPKLEEVMLVAGFRPAGTNVGSWITRLPFSGKHVEVKVDLLVPEAVGGAGRRGARLGAHGSKVARKVKGLEAALVDKGIMVIGSLEATDTRNYRMAVAGPAALLVAKLHKIGDREGEQGRSSDKDALDVLRLLRCVNHEVLADSFSALFSDKVAGPVSRHAVDLLRQLFARSDASGSQMAARAVAPLEAPATTAASCSVLARDLLAALAQP